jgi:glycosyltransferase involved in cell wall biosynthesis
MQLLGRKLVEKSLLRRSNHILVLSDYTRKKLSNVYKLRRSKITVIPGAVDIDRFKPTDDRVTIRTNLDLPANSFILLTVRNLEPRMGIENLILAYKSVLGKKSDIHLVIAGAGPMGQELRALVRDSGLNDRIRFTGYIPDNKLPAYYQMADLFILPTLDLEGFGLVTVEALSSGLPVLGTPVGGTKEILAHLGKEFLFADTTPESMSSLILEAMQTWAGDPSAYSRISQKCRKVAERYYSWESHIAKLENLCLRMIHQSSSHHPLKSRISSI